MTISVLVPTYQRVADLERCLAALEAQRRLPEEIIVIARRSDAATVDWLRARRVGTPPIRIAWSGEDGQVGALNVGLKTAEGEIVAITDDDAAPRPDWLARLEECFLQDHRIAGVGGRDAVVTASDAPNQVDVGRVQWWGRVVGNHHVGSGSARFVDVLKGANMSFRRAVIANGFDRRLRGDRVQGHNDLALSLMVRRSGQYLLYDPSIIVDHYASPRPGGDEREFAAVAGLGDTVHNETLALLEFLPGLQRAVFLVWAVAVGTRVAPGLAHCGLAIVARRPNATGRLLASLSGRLEGWRTWRRSRSQRHEPGT